MSYMHYDHLFEPATVDLTEAILSLLDFVDAPVSPSLEPDTSHAFSSSTSSQLPGHSEAGFPWGPPLYQEPLSLNAGMEYTPATISPLESISAEPQSISSFAGMSTQMIDIDAAGQFFPPYALSPSLSPPEQFAPSFEQLPPCAESQISWSPACSLPLPFASVNSPISPSPYSPTPESASERDHKVDLSDDDICSPGGSNLYRTASVNHHKRSSRTPRTSRRRSSSSSTSSTPSSPRHKGSQASPRNAQIYISPEAFERALRNRPCVCPGCGRASKTSADLERHMNTHRAKVVRKMWVCCGVPIEEAHEGIDEAHSYNGHRMVGGCKKSFSRKDALMRHLRDGEEGCCGNVDLAVALGILGPRSIVEGD